MWVVRSWLAEANIASAKRLLYRCRVRIIPVYCSERDHSINLTVIVVAVHPTFTCLLYQNWMTIVQLITQPLSSTNPQHLNIIGEWVGGIQPVLERLGCVGHCFAVLVFWWSGEGGGLLQFGQVKRYVNQTSPPQLLWSLEWSDLEANMVADCLQRCTKPINCVPNCRHPNSIATNSPELDPTITATTCSWQANTSIRTSQDPMFNER